MIRDYVDVFKPGIIAGNLAATAGGFCLASGGRVNMDLLLATLAGVFFIVASACVCNNLIDRKLDGIMTRTRNRAIASGVLSVRAACLYAAIPAIMGVALLGAATNILSVAVVSAGFIIYVGIYSLCLKRTCACATLIGSLAGAAPPLAGYCAASNRLDIGAAILSAIFILWQVPHYYAIGIFRFDDYAAAKIPILPVKEGVATAKKHIVGYILVFTAAAPMLTLCGYTGYSYLAVTVGAGLVWLFIAWSGYKAADDRLWGRKLYIFSILTILAVSFMMSMDATGVG